MKQRQKNGAYKQLKALTAIAPEKALTINIILLGSLVLGLIIHALFINHLNTVDYKLTDLEKESLRLVERNGELEARISEMQTLETIEERAIELGMVSVDAYTFLADTDTAVAKR